MECLLIFFSIKMLIGQTMLKVYAPLLCFFIYIVPSRSQNFHHKVNSCHIGDVIQNECVTCVCTSKALFECKSVDCIRTAGLKGINVKSTQTCIPSQLYVQNLITCICNQDGTWPHKSCYETFLSLPSTKVEKYSCPPDTYVKIDCNVCRCGPDGNIIPDRCTTNTCEEKSARRSEIESDSLKSSVYSNCIIKNWYSLAPCQFCYCVHENKLVCNTGHYYAKKLEVGKYNMEICGMDMLNQAMELIPENQNSIRQLIPPKIASGSSVIRQDVAASNAPDQNDQTAMNKFSNGPNNEENDNDDGDDEEDETNENNDGQDQDHTDSGEGTKTNNSPLGMMDMGEVVIPKVDKNKNDETSGSDSEDDNSSNSITDDSDESDDSHQSQDSGSDSDSDSRSVERKVDITRTYSEKVDSSAESSTLRSNATNNQHTTTELPVEDLEFVDNTLKINVPNVLNKVFRMALRKSMVSLSNDTHCTPGETYMHSCNMCFCLKNGKELCTANQCP